MGSSAENKTSSDTSTRALLVLACGGQGTAQGRLLASYDPLLKRIVREYLGPGRYRKEGEDILQHVRLAVLKALPGVRGRSRQALVAWLRKLVRSRLQDWDKAGRARRRKPQRTPVSLVATQAPEVAASTPTPSRIIMTKEEIDRLRRAIESAPERYRSVLWFLYEKDPAPPEIAAFLGKPPEATRKFVARALTSLRKALGSRGTSHTSP